MAIYLLAIFCLATLATSSPIERTEVAQPRIDDGIYYRLPTSVVPSEYLLVLAPNFTDFSFDGYVQINVTVVEETQNITLHASNITFLQTVVFNGTASLTIANATHDPTRDFYILWFDCVLKIGEYQIRINYTGNLQTQYKGFYRGYYTNAQNVTRYLAVTQFEATDARLALPCFDEPALKANFSVQIIREEDYNSISNTNRTSSERYDDNRYIDTFETTVKMSTYLLAFIVSDYTYIEGYRQRVYSRPEYIDNGDAQFALDVGITALQALENYTGINYTLSKIYQVSIPQFSAGAMENWGLVTYRETTLLYNKTTATIMVKQFIELVIAHEYTHQWFGDLVSPKWWNYIWLNEGFASYLEYYIGDKVKPSWRILDQFVVISLQNTMITDALATTRAMTIDAESPSEIGALFDPIAYEKSAAVLQMLSHAITEDAFRAGINKYLNAMQFSAADSNDLWNNLQIALNESYPDVLPEKLTLPLIMATWETQAGFPVINVTRDYTNKKVMITQERFILDNKKHGDTSKWYVPINFATADDVDFSDTSATYWLSNSSDLTLDLTIDEDDWIIVNKRATGYYRINYDQENWKLIAAYLDSDNYNQISPLNRAQLIDDAFTFAISGRLNYTVALELTKYLRRETDYVPLYAFIRAVRNLYTRINGAPNYDVFETRLAKNFDAAVAELGAVEKEGVDNDEEHVNNLNRITVIKWACRLGNERCRNLTTARLGDISSLSKDLRTNVLCGGLRSANATVWNSIYNRSLTETDSALRFSLSSALSCSEVEEILDKYVSNALSNGQSVFEDICGKGNFGVKYVLNYLINNWDKVYNSLNSNTGDVIIELSLYLTTEQHLQQLLQLNKTADPSLYTAFATAETYIQSHIEWTSVYLDDITTWISTELGDNDDDNNNDDDDNNNDDDGDNNNDGDDDESSEDQNNNCEDSASSIVFNISSFATKLLLLLMQ